MKLATGWRTCGRLALPSLISAPCVVTLPKPGCRVVPLRPNTDVALMLGLAHTLIAENLYDWAFLETYTVGFAGLRAYIMGESDSMPKDAAWASAITQIGADDSAPWRGAWPQCVP